MAKINGKNIGDIPGMMKDYAGGSVPSYYLPCDGSAVSRTTYKALFAAIGTTYGVGDGSTTFNVPDSRRRVHVGSGGTATGTLGNAAGSSGGEEVHTLSNGEMPVHNHSSSFASTGHAHWTGVAVGDHNDLFGGVLGPTSGTMRPRYGFRDLGTYGEVKNFQGSGNQTQRSFEALSDVANATASVNNDGGNQSHNNIQPSLVITKVIKF